MDKEHQKIMQELVDLLHKNNLSEIEYEVSGVRFRLSGNTTVSGQIQPTTTAVKEQPSVVKDESENYIVSPMVGVAYLSAEPGKAPYVSVGDKVVVGQTLCLVEAMKTFNPIKSDRAGIVREILIETGSPVEYNQPLFVVV